MIGLCAVQEDGSPCSIFTFDIAANKSRMPLTKNAVRKSRTLRHPGVIKVLDTIEVRDWQMVFLDTGAHNLHDPDRVEYLYRDRTCRSAVLACQAEESGRGNCQMGVTYCGGSLMIPFHRGEERMEEPELTGDAP